MLTKIIEVTNNDLNWGKFMLLRPDHEWERKALMAPESQVPLLHQIGWSPSHLWVLDLQTGEGACFHPGGYHKYDLDKHKVWVCPMFEPFLEWLYKQDLADFSALPDLLNLPDAPFAMSGYRREGNDPSGENALAMLFAMDVIGTSAKLGEPLGTRFLVEGAIRIMPDGVVIYEQDKLMDLMGRILAGDRRMETE